MKIVKPSKDPKYLEKTEKCPLCYGRGRVPREGYCIKGKDTYKEIYEEEKAIEEAEQIIDKAKG